MNNTKIEIKDLGTLLEKKHAMYLEGRKFVVSASVDDKDELTVTVVLENSDQTFYYPIEARLNVNKEEMSAKDAALFLVDYIDLYFDDYFEEDEALNIPIDWCDYEYDATNFQMKGQVYNKLVESQANALLGDEFSIVE